MWSEPISCLHCWLGNVLRATMACTISTSERQKVVRTCGALCVLTWKCSSRRNTVTFLAAQLLKVVRDPDFFTLLTWKRASGHNGAHFSTSQLPRVVRPWCAFYILTWKCASRHNACTFSTAQLPKVVRTWCAFYILTWKFASHHTGVQFFISHLASWLRTRRSSEPTFRPSRATNHWKNTVNRDFPTFSRTCIFFLLTLSLLWCSHLLASPLWLFPPLLLHLSILSEVWLLNFLRLKFGLRSIYLRFIWGWF